MFLSNVFVFDGSHISGLDENGGEDIDKPLDIEIE